jgi:hypothetical protein
MVDLDGRGERIRTSDLTVPNEEKWEKLTTDLNRVATTSKIKGFCMR